MIFNVLIKAKSDLIVVFLLKHLTINHIVCRNNPDSVGIYTAYGSYGLKYVVYLNDFNSNISLQRDFNDFEIAVIRARQWYETLLAYYNLVEKDCVNTL